MKPTMMLASLAIAAATLLPAAPTLATHGSGGCGSPTGDGGLRWQSLKSAWCTFDIRGLPVSVWGEARDPNGNRSVGIRVWVTFQQEYELSETTGHEPLTLVECTHTGAGFATCEDDLSIGEVVDTQRGFLGRLRCMAEAIPAGSWAPQLRYYCSVGTGIG